MNVEITRCDQCGKEVPAKGRYAALLPQAKGFISLTVPKPEDITPHGYFSDVEHHDFCGVKCLEDFLVKYKTRSAKKSG